MKIINRSEFPRSRAYIIAQHSTQERNHRDMVKNIGTGVLFVKASRKLSPGQVARRGHDGFAVDFNEPIDALVCKNSELPEIAHESVRKS